MWLVVACGASSKGTPVTVAEIDTSPSALAPTRPRAASTSRAEIRDRPKQRAASLLVEGTHFVGTYVCRQGETNADLEIERVKASDTERYEIDLIFHFMQEVTKVGGAIRMHGTFDSETYELRLNPGEWIERPATYVGVSVHANVSHDGRVIDGKMVHEGCGSIHVVRR